MKKSIIIDTALKIVRKEVKKYKTPIVDLIAVQTKDPYKVLVATILSARTKDETTAKAAAKLFKKAGDLINLALLSESEIIKLIYPVGFYKMKAGYLKKLPKALEAFDSTVPDDIDSLLTLPGVGRKTANLVVAVAFKKYAICVDTHVHRIMNIWGYVQTKTPLETEMTLRNKLPQKYWLEVNGLLVAFGQSLCKPIAAHCDTCPLNKECPQIGASPRKTGLNKKRPAPKGAKTFISWNVNGLRAVEKKGFIEIVKESHAEIFAVQETKAQPDQLSDEIKNIQGYHSYWCSSERKGYAGVGVYSQEKPENVLYGLGNKEFDHEGRVLTLEFKDFFFVNVYFPNAQHELLRIHYKIDFNNAILSFVQECAATKSVVICGDFNVAHKPIDLKNPKPNEKNPGFSPRERSWMDKFIEKEGYIDTFRKFSSEPDQYTWWSYRFSAREKNIGWRIDYFCTDPQSDKRIVDAGIKKDIPGSDHCPVFLSFK